MIPVEQALETILRSVEPMPPEKVSLLEARGRVLAEDVAAPRDLPPQDNSAMDGYAFRFLDVPSAPGRLRVTEAIAAGGRGVRPVGPGQAARIMTGAPIPEGADTVVPVEDTRTEGDEVTLVAVPARGANVRLAGEDVRRGERVLPGGTVVRAAEVGMLASLGRSFVLVHQRPRVAILATGDEIADLDAPADPAKIVNSNTYGVAAQVAEAGGVAVMLGIGRDDPDGLLEMLERAATADVVLTTGGVSMGDYDHVKGVFDRWGVVAHFWKVAIKPGKPMVFGVRGKAPVFGLPGNPVSALVAFEEFVRPVLRRLQGHRRLFRPVVEAILGEEAGAVTTKPGRMDFVRCRVERAAPPLGFRVVSVKRQGAGLLKTLVEANGLLVLSEASTGAKPGDRVRVQLYDYEFLEGIDADLRDAAAGG
ncbi:MAG: molybdopterin molybdotransferase MoeA [Deltaproteobacteria bacterium]|nr:molybdopterin molybdotransferase MoeA [Deltaproteobacteria bacterium]